MFTSPLIVKALPSPGKWKTVAPLIWCDNLYGRIVVPPDFETDLASVPGVVKALPDFDPNGLSRRPAVVHDWLYTNKPFERYVADEFLRHALIVEGMPLAIADAFYGAVRLFGESHWSS